MIAFIVFRSAQIHTARTATFIGLMATAEKSQSHVEDVMLDKTSMRPFQNDPKPLMRVCMVCVGNDEAREMFPNHRISHGACRLHELETYERDKMIEPEEAKELAAIRLKEKMAGIMWLMCFSACGLITLYLLAHGLAWAWRGFRIVG